jgi:hypothetical protein
MKAEEGSFRLSQALSSHSSYTPDCSTGIYQKDDRPPIKIKTTRL